MSLVLIPFPGTAFRHILAVLVDVLLVLDFADLSLIIPRAQRRLGFERFAHARQPRVNPHTVMRGIEGALSQFDNPLHMIAKRPPSFRPGTKQPRPLSQPWSLPAESASINATARAVLNTTISEGINQKLDRRLLQRCLNLFMGQIPLPVPDFRQILTVFINVILVLDELVLHHLLQVGPLIAQLR